MGGETGHALALTTHLPPPPTLAFAVTGRIPSEPGHSARVGVCLVCPKLGHTEPALASASFWAVFSKLNLEIMARIYHHLDHDLQSQPFFRIGCPFVNVECAAYIIKMDVHHVSRGRVFSLEKLNNFSVHAASVLVSLSLDAVAQPVGKAKHELVLLITWEGDLFHSVELTLFSR